MCIRDRDDADRAGDAGSYLDDGNTAVAQRIDNSAHGPRVSEPHHRDEPLVFYPFEYPALFHGARRSRAHPRRSNPARWCPSYTHQTCLLYTSDAADDLLCVDLG